MFTLKWSFKILALLGFNPPSHWTSLWKKILYKCHAFILTVSLYALECTQLLDLVFSDHDSMSFSDNLYMTLVFFCDCCKTITLFLRRENIVNLINTLKEEPFTPMNKEETNIRKKFMKQIERNTIIYTLIIDLFVLEMWIGSLLTDYRKRKLKLRVWIPYDYSSSVLFAITYFHQVVATIFATNLLIACDSLFSGFLVHIYCQFELLQYRLKNLEQHSYYSVQHCAYHHRRIYEFAAEVNKEFTAIISIQFMVNTFSLCFNYYRLSQLHFGSKFIETTMFAFCVLAQIFYYCWYGNEVKLKSLEIVDVALQSTLMQSLDSNKRKMFMMISRRALEPIQFTSIHIVSMNLESFITLLKTSYSAYTMLQQTS